jgi:hypothetical protein
VPVKTDSLCIVPEGVPAFRQGLVDVFQGFDPMASKVMGGVLQLPLGLFACPYCTLNVRMILTASRPLSAPASLDRAKLFERVPTTHPADSLTRAISSARSRLDRC